MIEIKCVLSTYVNTNGDTIKINKSEKFESSKELLELNVKKYRDLRNV